MALRGTLKDFGIADILQLLGSQSKSGTLTLTRRAERVRIYFATGNVVACESSTRQRQDLLGAMLQRAGLINEEQLQDALQKQQQKRRRLGDLLVEAGALSPSDLQDTTRLQTIETVHRIFFWDGGNYEFEPNEEPTHAAHVPIRSEMLLMDGFRQVDEWPRLRRHISSYAVTFKIVQDLAVVLAAQTKSDDINLDDAFGGGQANEASSGTVAGALNQIGPHEKRVYGLIAPKRDAQKIIDLSRLGEFETCKALVNLIDAGVIAVQPHQFTAPTAEATVGAIHAGQIWRQWPRLLLLIGVMAVLFFALSASLRQRGGLLRRRTSHFATLRDVSLEWQLARGTLAHIRQALAIYEATHGQYPAQLADLVDEGLLNHHDLNFPWQNAYHYAPQGQSYVLLRPLF